MSNHTASLLRNNAADGMPILGELARANRTMATRIFLFQQAVANRVGINPTDLKCLDFILEKHMPMTAGEIATLSHLSTSAVTKVLDRLEKAGFLCRRPDHNDRRRVLVEPNMAKISKEIAPHFFLFARSIDEFNKSHYSARELALIQQYVAGLIPIIEGETAKLLSHGSD